MPHNPPSLAPEGQPAPGHPPPIFFLLLDSLAELGAHWNALGQTQFAERELAAQAEVEKPPAKPKPEAER